MANRIYGDGSNSPPDGNWSTGANWTGDVKPQAGDDVIFRGADADEDTNCLMDEAPAALGSMDVQAGYDGDIDFNDQSFSCGDMTLAGTGEVKCGSGTITCSGDFNNTTQGTFTRETSTFVFSGAGKTINTDSAARLYDVTVSGTTTGTIKWANDFEITGSHTGNCHTYSGSINVNGGTLAGAVNTMHSESGGGSITNSGTWSIANTRLERNITINAGTYGGSWGCTQDWQDKTVTFGGNCVFTGDVSFDANKGTGHTYTIDCATNDVSLEFQGDFTIKETGGDTLAWSKAATGTVTFAKAAGTQEYTDSTAAIQDLGKVVHDGAGTLKLLTEMECTTFDGDSGTFDPNGQTLDCSGNVDWDTGWDFIGDADAMNGCTSTVGGNFTADGQTCKATAGWTLTVTGTAVASGVGAVAHSNAGGGTEIDASAGPWTDNGNNTNWNFGGAGPGVDELFAARQLQPVIYNPAPPVPIPY